MPMFDEIVEFRIVIEDKNLKEAKNNFLGWCTWLQEELFDAGANMRFNIKKVEQIKRTKNRK